MVYHHIGNWKITVSAQSSFSCSARTSAVSVPASNAAPELGITRSGLVACSPKSAASTAAFQFIAYRSLTRTSWPAASSVATARSFSEPFSDRGSGWA